MFYGVDAPTERGGYSIFVGRVYLLDGLALLKSWAGQSRSGAPAAFLFQQKRDEGVASTRFGSFSTKADGFSP